jgi:transposase
MCYIDLMRKLNTPNPENSSVEELQFVQRATADRDMANRLMAIIMLLNGIQRESVLSCISVSEVTLRAWIRAFNESGIEGLATKPKSGRPPKLSNAQKNLAAYLFSKPGELGEDFWTKRKFHSYINRKLNFDLGYSTLAKYLRDKGYRLLVPRPKSPERNDQLRGEFLDKLRALLEKDSEAVWFCDEAGFMADPRPKPQYAMKGTKPVCPKTGLHIRESVIGSVQPTSGEFVSLIFNRVDRDVFQYYLDCLAESTDGRRVVLVLDNATWHRSKMLNWHHIEPMYLPPYSPDLNPIERLWAYIKDNYFNNWYTKKREDLQQRLINAINKVTDNNDIVSSVCHV